MPRPSSPSRRVGFAALAWSGAWLLAAALYLLLIDIIDLPELIVGAVAAAIAAFGFELAREQRIAGVATRLSWLRWAYRPLLRVPSDVVAVSIGAARQLLRPRRKAGVFRVARFRCGPASELESGRHALAEALGSLAPNTIVIGIDFDRDAILVHQLSRKGSADAIDVLRLG
jgi:multisubunit Na+/H+ antiporter MnhE subunit